MIPGLKQYEFRHFQEQMVKLTSQILEENRAMRQEIVTLREMFQEHQPQMYVFNFQIRIVLCAETLRSTSHSKM
jgi:hypothetical protein